MKYDITSGGSMEELIKSVQEYIDAGWMCTGGVATSGGDMATRFYQAMVFYPETENLSN